MSVTKQTVAGGATQFDGTADKGLFTFANNTGSPAIQVRLNSVSFSTASTIVGWTLNLIDPSDDQVIELLTGTGTDFVLGGPAGFMILPTNSGGQPWHMTFVTDTMAGAGSINVDLDFVVTES